MRISRSGVAGAAVAAIIVAVTPANAHHSWSTNYDLSQTRQIDGTVARVVFRSPHSAIVIDVETPGSELERWTVEWGSPQRLRERGVTEGTIKSGDRVFVSGNPHRDPAVNSLRMQSLRRTSDGLQLE